MTGHDRLLQDLRDLLAQADAYAFHDFRNELYGTPKVELYTRLTALAAQVKAGRYDNRPDEDPE